MTAQTSPERRRAERSALRPSLLALLVSLAVTGVGWLGAVYAAPESFETEAAWGAGAAAVALCAAVVTATAAVSRSRRERERMADMTRRHERLANEIVPAVVSRLRQGDSAPAALAAAPAPEDGPETAASKRVLTTLAEEISRSESGKAAAMAACANAAGRMQALATSMLADLREMEHRHADETVLADLLHLDHRTAQAGRLADSIAVLTGARSGRRWGKPIVMESILRGAMGRIGGYQRVRLHSAVNVAVAGHAAEGVMHALAELLDNAANFSPPTSEVHVYVEEVPAGVVITVEDSGLVMGEVALRRAERLVSTDEPLDLASLSGTRLGLAVVGQLARKHGLKVSFRPSARGGTGALMMIPHELITRPKPTDDLAPRPARTRAVRGTEPSGGAGPVATPEHAPASDTAATRTGGLAAATTGDDTGEVMEYGPSGLPKRRRGRTLANAHPGGVPAPAKPRASRSSEESASRLRAFRQAVRGKPGTAEGPAETPEHTPRASSRPDTPATSASHSEDDTA